MDIFTTCWSAIARVASIVPSGLLETKAECFIKLILINADREE